MKCILGKFGSKICDNESFESIIDENCQVNNLHSWNDCKEDIDEWNEKFMSKNKKNKQNMKIEDKVDAIMNIIQKNNGL
ncbi:WSSV027 [White spot syndrome virus]|uniref:WSSV027 n=1 Tax=White spot syndrome virus TaxID=342409 RepID=A0A2I6SBI2_9VIRU|nr:WSSV027 [White spot syndrome virus]